MPHILSFVLPLVLGAGAGRPAPPPSAAAGENQLTAEFRLQGGRIAHACKPKLSALGTCPVEFLTDHPIHLAVGSLAPGNGFALGPAFVTHRLSDQYDMSWNADVVRSANGSWRGGVYFKLVLTPVPGTVAVPIGSPEAADGIVIHPYPIVDAYAQTTSLQTVSFFGLGPDSAKTAQAAFGMTETVTGGRVIYPLFAARQLRKLNLAAIGDINGRFVSLRNPGKQDVPSLTDRYAEATAPGISSQPAFVQLGEGIRMKPVAFNERLHLNYLFSLAQFAALSESRYSFRRWTADLDHEFSIYRTAIRNDSRDTHGPDDCSAAPGDSPCPSPSISRNRYGAIGLRLYASRSTAGTGSAVPFYFQQTLGGSDIDGVRRLSAYDDYRFRGPGAFMIRESLEHYIYGVIGVSLAAEQGTVASADTGLKLAKLKHSTAAGVSLRAGGLPVAHVMWAWGAEGRRFVAVVSTSLLGGGARPSWS